MNPGKYDTATVASLVLPASDILQEDQELPEATIKNRGASTQTIWSYVGRSPCDGTQTR